ncbi:MAG: amidohydrolase [Aminivibrio sp.]|jgi:amidohydrolase
MKERIKCRVDEIGKELVALSRRIHENPETAFEERRALAWQVELLKKHGFEVEAPFCGLETAFRAVKKGAPGGPVVAFLSEYDALKGAGHACGHNIIAASSAGAGIALAGALGGMAGEVRVIGTPGEEEGGGKVYIAERGGFDDVDFALMVHPSTKNLIGRGGLAAQTVKAVFRGKSAHSAIPEKGVNALTALIAFFNGIDTLRQTWPNAAKINGIITRGGSAPNIIPDEAEALFTVRASRKKELTAMYRDLERVAEGAAAFTGATFTLEGDPAYAERYPNSAMGEAFRKNMEDLGEVMNYPDPEERVGSSDVGNVSLLLPTIHEYLAIAEEGVAGHSPEFREASASPRGDEVVLLAAKGLALTGWDLLADEGLRAAAAEEYRREALPFRE